MAEQAANDLIFAGACSLSRIAAAEWRNWCTVILMPVASTRAD